MPHSLLPFAAAPPSVPGPPELPVWAAWVVLVAALVAAFWGLLKASVGFIHWLGRVDDMIGVAPVVLEIGEQFRHDSGSSLKDQVVQTQAAAAAALEAAAAAKAAVLDVSQRQEALALDLAEKQQKMIEEFTAKLTAFNQTEVELLESLMGDKRRTERRGVDQKAPVPVIGEIVAEVVAPTPTPTPPTKE